jgi:hypothetical protein
VGHNVQGNWFCAEKKKWRHTSHQITYSRQTFLRKWLIFCKGNYPRIDIVTGWLNAGMEKLVGEVIARQTRFGLINSMTQ